MNFQSEIPQLSSNAWIGAVVSRIYIQATKAFGTNSRNIKLLPLSCIYRGYCAKKLPSPLLILRCVDFDSVSVFADGILNLQFHIFEGVAANTGLILVAPLGFLKCFNEKFIFN